MAAEGLVSKGLKGKPFRNLLLSCSLVFLINLQVDLQQ